MKPSPLPLRSRGPKPESAAALVITLIFLVLIAIMILSMSDSLRVERGASVSYVNQVMSSQMAERGINHITATLNKETGDVNRNWISQPGQLVLGAEEDNTATTRDERKVLEGAVLDGTSRTVAKILPLHSGTPSGKALADVLKAPNLNIASWDNAGEPLITSTTSEMRVKWIYVRQDGTLETDEEPNRTNSGNPIIGRYAFWADDESTKVNLNLAWSGTNANNKLSPGSPTRVSLAALPGFTETDATTLHNVVTTDNFNTLAGFFNSPSDARRVTSLATKLKQNKFDVTHYNHDPQTTFFNEPRIVLTTQEKYAPRDAAGNILKDANGVPYFLDILKVANTDPGQIYKVLSVSPSRVTEDVIDPAKVDKIIKKLIGYLQRTDWPMVPDTATQKSFQAKYFDGKPERLAQIALGIIEYVRCAESSRVIVEPLRVVYKNGVYERVTGWAYGGDNDTFIGSPRRIYITEMGIWRAPGLVTDPASPVKDKLKIKLYLTLHLAENGGIEQVDLLAPEPGKKFFAWTSLDNTAGAAVFNADGENVFLKNGSPEIPTNASIEVKAANIIGGNNILKAGEYRTLVFDYYYWDVTLQQSATPPAPPVPTMPANFRFYPRYALRIGTDQLNATWASSLEIAPLGNPPTYNNESIRFGNPFQDSDKTTNHEKPEPTNTSNPVLTTYVTDDPRVNGTPRDWKLVIDHEVGTPLPKALATLGSAAVSMGTGKPPRDSNSLNRVTDASFRIPYPKDLINPLSKNPYGMVTSPAELGFVHTGLQGDMSSTTGGVSWRSLRLQATKGVITSVPDWALMDLFAAPADVSPAAAALLSPHGTGAGRMNINVGKTVEPFGIVRSAPLKAVLLNARTVTSNTSTRLTAAQVDTLVDNIRNLALANTQAGQKYGYSGGFNSPGEIVEIKGIADSGEDSEELVRSISNLINTRSNVFGVYTVGQALKQVNGTLQVTGEQRQHAILERYLDSAGLVRFRTVYFRNLNP